MFDIGFSEMVVVALVALIVIGPERLPKVARTLGHLLGRLQRYVNDVKTDIQREMQLEELKKLQAEIENQARGIERTVVSEMQTVEKDLKAPAESLAEVMASTGQSIGGTESTPAIPVPAAATPSTLGDFDPKDVPAQPLPPPPAGSAQATTPAAGAEPATVPVVDNSGSAKA